MKKILIVIDMQNDFIDGALGTKEAVGIVDNVVSKIKNFNDYDGKIFVTLDTHFHNYLETSEGKKLPVPHCIKMTYGWLLNEKVLNALSEKSYETIEKSTFSSYELYNKICSINEEHCGTVEIEIIGLCTDICVITNALVLNTFFSDNKITVDASCCAGVTPETHKAALEIMKLCQIDVIGE